MLQKEKGWPSDFLGNVQLMIAPCIRIYSSPNFDDVEVFVGPTRVIAIPMFTDSNFESSLKFKALGEAMGLDFFSALHDVTVYCATASVGAVCLRGAS